MNHKRLWVAAGIIALVIILGFALSAPHTHDVSHEALTEVATTTAPTVTLHDVFKKGVHTISGSLLAPDACTTLTPQATLLGDASSTESIALDISMPTTSGVCLELPTIAKFSTTITAPATLPIQVTVNGAVASTTSS